MKKNMGLLLLLGLCCLTGCQSAGTAAAPELLEPVAVKMDTAEAKIGDMYKVQVYDGEVTPYVEEAYFTTEGVLGEIRVTLGEEVKKGQVLAVLDTQDLQDKINALEEEIADVSAKGKFSDEKAQIDIEIAQEELEIMRIGTASDEACSAKEVAIERLETQLRQDQEMRELELEKMKVLLAQQKKELEGTSIYAPFDGKVVFISQMKAKDPVNSYDPIICVADESRLCVQTDYISKTTIAGAQKLLAKIDGVDYSVTYVEEDDSEYISKMLSGAEVRSEFSFEMPDSAVRSGHYAALMLYYSCKEDVLTIPVNALYRDGAGQYVYRIEDGERVRCSVKTGLTNDVEAEILDGLAEGDVVYVKD